MLGKIGISVDFMSSWFGVRSVDFKLNTQMNVWYAFGVGPQIEALFGFEENHNMYFAGVSMWALNIPFYLWGVEQYGFSWTIINVDIGWNLENTSKQQFVFYTSFGLHL
jgi:hypothetical protein